MLKKFIISSGILIVIAMGSAVEIFAKNTVTCSGGRLYIGQTSSSGEEICWDTNLTCDGEWTHTWERGAASGGVRNLKTGRGADATLVGSGSYIGTQSVSNAGTTSGATVAPSDSYGGVARKPNNAPTSQEVLALLQKVKQSDLKLYYKAPSSVADAFKKRVSWPTASKGHITIPSDIPAPTFPGPLSGPVMRGICPGNLYPNPQPGGGTACYPCLGCHPCGDSYCSNSNLLLKRGDLAPALLNKGYTISSGRIQKTNQVGSSPRDSPKN